MTSQTTFVMTCSGTGVMQAALENCVARRVLVTTCGAFSERWYNIAESLGYEVDRLDAGWGKAVDPDELADHLARHHRAHYDAVTITHNETSTGVTNDVAALAAVVREEAPDALVLVDAVSSLGGIPVEFDSWGADVCLASVQKCIALPPGITVVAASRSGAGAREEASVPRHVLRLRLVQGEGGRGQRPVDAVGPALLRAGRAAGPHPPRGGPGSALPSATARCVS